MRKFTFQIGSEFEARQGRDSWFENAIDEIRDALSAPAPLTIPVRKVRRRPTRFEARLGALSRYS